MDLLDQPMSDSEVRDFLPDATLLTYPDFAELVKRGMTLSEFLGPSKTAILLYETKPRTGHYVTVFERPGNIVEVFDSLGYVPDDELEFIPKHYRDVSNQDHSYLLWLLRNSGKHIEYNEVPLQKDKPGVATCGRWCIWRIANRNMPLKTFQQAFYGCSGDILVSSLIR